MKIRKAQLLSAVILFSAQMGAFGQEDLDDNEDLVKPAPSKHRHDVYLNMREDLSPVVVEFSDKSEKLEALQTDLATLTRVIREALDPGAPPDLQNRANGRVAIRGPAGNSVRGMYVDGFGALVFVKVNFPLLGPGVAQSQPEPSADTEWNRAKQDLVAKQRTLWATESVAGQPYDAARVETLKGEILSAFKQAANLPNINPAEFVSVVVYGPPPANSTRTGKPEIGGTVLAIRTTKSDIDALVAGKLDPEQFKAKAAFTAYRGSGYGLTSVNSWLKSSGFQLR